MSFYVTLVMLSQHGLMVCLTIYYHLLMPLVTSLPELLEPQSSSLAKGKYTFSSLVLKSHRLVHGHYYPYLPVALRPCRDSSSLWMQLVRTRCLMGDILAQRVRIRESGFKTWIFANVFGVHSTTARILAQRSYWPSLPLIFIFKSENLLPRSVEDVEFIEAVLLHLTGRTACIILSAASSIE